MHQVNAGLQRGQFAQWERRRHTTYAQKEGLSRSLSVGSQSSGAPFDNSLAKGGSVAVRLNAKDLPPEMLKKLGIRAPRNQNFTKESVRSWSLKALTLLAELSQDQRRRVLEHALKVNRL